VLDASGSMGDFNKMRECKTAMSKIIDQLQPGDRLSLVTFDSNPTVRFEAMGYEKKGAMQEIVSSMHASGGTDLLKGLRQAATLLKSNAQPLRATKLFVLSDGLTPSKDEIFRTAAQLAKDGMNIQSFGVGEDFDEALMMGIAEHGQGEYFFLDNDSDFTRIIGVAFQGLTSLMASKATLTVKGVAGTIVNQALGYDNKVLMDGVQIGDLRHNSTVRLFFRLAVPGSLAAAAYDVSTLLKGQLPVQVQPVFECKLTYTPVATETPQTASASLSVAVVDSNEAVTAQRNLHVEELMNVQETASRSQQVLQAINEGKLIEAEEMVKVQMNEYAQLQQSVGCSPGSLCFREASTKMR